MEQEVSTCHLKAHSRLKLTCSEAFEKGCSPCNVSAAGVINVRFYEVYWEVNATIHFVKNSVVSMDKHSSEYELDIAR